MLRDDKEYPVDVDEKKHGAYASPVPEQFGGEVERETNRATVSRMLRSYASYRPYLLNALASNLACNIQRWTSRDWKEIMGCHVNMPLQPKYLRQLGLDAVLNPAAIDYVPAPEETSYGIPETLMQYPLEPLAPSSVSTAPTSPFSSRSDLPPSTAPTTRAASPAGSDDYDDYDDDIDMTPVTPLPPTQIYFVPLNAELSPRLGRHDERYLAEPSVWRMYGPGKQRAKSDFTYWIEMPSSNSADPTLEFRLVGADSRKTLIDEDSDLWWDYNHSWVFIFAGPPHASEGPLRGERLTVPLRLWVDGGSRPKFVHGTDKAPRQCRLWHAEPLSQRLDVPLEPLGAVGSRCALRWDLNDSDYKKLFPTAPRLPSPEELLQVNVNWQQRTERRNLVEVRPEPAPAPAPEPAPAPAPAPPTAASPSTSTPSSAPSQYSGKPLNAALTPDGPIRFMGQVLEPYDLPPGDKTYCWPDTQTRALMMWDIAELSFRLELCLFDNMLSLLHPHDLKLRGGSKIERLRMICNIWDLDSFIPTAASSLTSPEWLQRVDRVTAFYELISTWPRASEIVSPPPAQFDGGEDEFIAWEKTVWHAYARTYGDYELREAPVPLQYPYSEDIIALLAERL
ncbi:hypothetical protein AURDEDRAFT_170296 [Auricularia subglabra TFB-10046 SS5]|nr:hypothetical protein AURDEDRAFT_170296 [Auricularia subglabra TFB-10046 SS5]